MSLSTSPSSELCGCSLEGVLMESALCLYSNGVGRHVGARVAANHRIYFTTNECRVGGKVGNLVSAARRARSYPSVLDNLAVVGAGFT
jgi:hypothetical protein